MDISQSNTRVVVDNLVWGHVELLVPYRYVLNANTMTSDARFAATDTGGDLNMFPR